MLQLLFSFFPQCILLTTGSVLTTEDAEMNRMPFKSPNPHMKGSEHRTGCRDEAGLVLRPQSLEQRHEWKIGWWEGGREGRREGKIPSQVSGWCKNNGPVRVSGEQEF